MTTRTLRHRRKIKTAVSLAAVAALMVPTVAYAAPIDPEDPGPASGPCPPGWSGTEGDCDPPNDIDAVDDSDVGDPQESDPGGDPPDGEFPTSETAFDPTACGAPADDMILPDDEMLPEEPILVPEEEPVYQTPRRQAPRQQTDGLSEAEIRQVMLIIENDRDQRIGQINSSPMQEESTSAMGPSDLEGLGISQ